MVFFELRRDVWCFSRIMTGNSGSLWCGPREVQSPFGLQGGVQHCSKSQQGNQASRRIEGGITSSFSRCSRKPWVPSTCDSDLRELLMVPMGSHEYCGVGRGLSRLHWVWCNGRGPHPDLRQEPQVSSPVLMWASCCVCHFKQGVRCRRVWRDGTLLSPRFVKGVSGLQPS